MTKAEFKDLLKDAKKGDMLAQYSVGNVYADENASNWVKGVDLKKAMKWYKKAADTGHPKAQWLLAGGYFQGLGVKKDLEQAKYWLEKSANQGNPDGQLSLGTYYLSVKDYGNAQYWIERAAAQGHQEANTILSSLSVLFGNKEFIENNSKEVL